MSEEKVQEIRFVNLVSALAASAMQQMGKLVNPLTGKSETNLEGARQAIDMLTMLEGKTKGNLNEQEEKLLKTTLGNLQLNYVEEVNRKPVADTQEKPN